MNKTNFFVFIICIFSVFFTNAIETKAMNTGFSTEELSEEMQNTFMSNINISLLTEEPTKRGVMCFDVNEQGMIAICKKGIDGEEVCIYTSEGKFLYGYTFDCSQSFGVEWDNEYINIYFVRSDVIVSLDSNGNILDIKEVQNTRDNNTHSNAILHSNTRVVGDTTYIIRNNMGIFNWIAFSYSQIITIDAEGIEHVVYDVSSTQLFKTIAIIVIACVFVAIAVTVIIRQSIRRNSEKKHEDVK